MNFSVLKTTSKWSDYWVNRKIDWKTSYLDTWNHPHRAFIVDILKQFNWLSLVELGCGPGANLVKILQTFPGNQLGGVDVNPEAIALAEKTFKGGLFKVNNADDVMMSDKSTDVTLTDMMLIYVDPLNIGRYIKEIKRITRKYVVLCEFHSPSFWERLKIRFTSGYNTYNYKKLLEAHDFYDIVVVPVPQSVWPDTQKIRHIIVAKVPPR